MKLHSTDVLSSPLCSLSFLHDLGAFHLYLSVQQSVNVRKNEKGQYAAKAKLAPLNKECSMFFNNIFIQNNPVNPRAASIKSNSLNFFIASCATARYILLRFIESGSLVNAFTSYAATTSFI